jgi:hypothetical protein
MQEGVMRIELPPPPRKIYFAIIFMFFLLSTMSAARLFPHWHSGSGRDPRGLLFDTVLFAFFGLFNLVMFAARFSVEISRDRFRVVRHLLGVRLERSYRMAEISHLRFTPYPNDLRKGVLSFDRKGRTRWLPMVNLKQAEIRCSRKRTHVFQIYRYSRRYSMSAR